MPPLPSDARPPLKPDDELFGEAFELPAADRPAFLDRACGHDRDQRARIEALLAAHDHPGGFLDAPAYALPGRPADEGTGDVIDRYTLVQKLGEGGCGSVYLAEQKVPVRRRVALKVIKLGMDTRQVIARFEAERQALALMDHPGIARVFDAGATDSGRPYFVMEFVDGVPINRFCDDHRLTLAQRLELFQRVCAALQHAHQKGIIHRDIKPSNILVAERDGAAEPKVIDFGIAKATQERLTEQTLLTGVDQFIGTPSYMSPEQADQRVVDIDTRSDVYSLGVLLYELLTGRLPFDATALQNGGIEKVRRTICETEPPRPSARFAALPAAQRATEAERRGTSAAALAAELRDDLDWIAVRCLEKDRNRRYASAQALADDVRRYLAQEPVTARPPSTAYRARRFVARHRVACASVAAVVAALLAGTVVSVRQAIRATEAEHAAQAERDAANRATRIATDARADALRRQEQAEDLLSFMIGGNFRAELKNTRVEVLDAVDNKAMAYFASLDPRDLTDTVLAGQAKALYQIGETRMDQARYTEATAAFSASYARAAALVVRHPKDGDMLFERGQAEYWLGFVARRRGDFPGAREWLTRYRDSAVALAALEGDKPRAQRELGYGHHNLAVLDLDLGNLAEAQAGFVAERAVVEPMLKASPDDPALRFSMANIASWLGTVAEADGRYADAIGHYSEHVSRAAEVSAAQPKVARWRLRLADAAGLSGDLLAIMGRNDEARAAFAKAKALREALVAQDPKNRQWQYAALFGELRELALAFGDHPTAAQAEELAKVRAGLEGLVKAEPSSVMFTAALANACRLEGQWRYLNQRPDAMEPVARALQLGEPLIDQARANRRAVGEFVQSCLLAGRIAQAQGQAEIARQHWERGAEVMTHWLANTNDWRILDPAAQTFVLLGQTDRARPLAERLRGFGYHPLDPLAASTIDSAISQASSN